jgi:F-type H+-transporting ATPase subunit delta
MPETIAKDLTLAEVYAAALFALCEQAGTTDAVHGELEELVRLVETEPGLAAFFSSLAIGPDDREESLERMFRGRLSDLLLNTLQVMSRHGRLELFRPLLRAYVLRVQEARRQIEVQATSAIELDAAQKAEVHRVAQALSGKQPVIEYLVDPGLIGGLVLQIGDWRYDNSVRQHLHAARGRLSERGQRGLRSGIATESG